MFRPSLTVLLAAASGLAVILAPAAVSAQQPEAKATFRDWSVFVREVDGDSICFAATEATDKSPKSANHGDVFFLVATWKSGAAREQPSLMTGYALNAKPAPTVRIGSDKWDMYTSDNEAFIESASEEGRLVAAMRRGADMRISAVSQRGTATSYVISLRGVSAALDRATQECR